MSHELYDDSPEHNFKPNYKVKLSDKTTNEVTGLFATSDITRDGQDILKEEWLKRISKESNTRGIDEDVLVDQLSKKLNTRLSNETTQPKPQLKKLDIQPKLVDVNGNSLKESIQEKSKIITSHEEAKETYEGRIITKVSENDKTGNGPSTAEMAEIMVNMSHEISKEISIHSKKELDSATMTLELLKCRMSALYFIENYVSVPVAGGRVSMKESEQWNATDKYKIIIQLFQQHDSVLYMSSRQSGKTTTSAMYLLWCMVFFPKIQISYLTLDKNRAIDMISRMKEMMDSLPKWLQVKPKSNAERLSYYELSNGSKITASFVSGSNDPDKVGRGLSSPIVFIDETAFIPHADIVWGALQPSVSAAKVFARKNGYPNGVIFTSTPNGAGDNFFYKVYQNSVKFDDIYDYESMGLYDDYKKEFSKEGKNAFISVVLHWSEFRSQEWYEEQKKELNFNQKKINQELDLAFLGSDACIFSDDVIGLLIPKRRSHHIKLPYGNEMDFFDEIDPAENYLLGVDTAMSAGSNSDYSAVVLTRASDGKPIGEWKGRFSVVKRFAQVVKTIIKSLKVLYGLSSRTLTVVIERNSIGKETLEELIYDESDFDYEIYLFKEQVGTGKVKEWVPGLYTSNSGRMGSGKRDKMFNMLMTYVNEKPYSIHGRRLIDELRNLEQKTNGRIEAGRNQHDDIVMAWNFCLYARRVLIDSGQLFIKGETKLNKAAIEADLLGMVLDTGNALPASNENKIIHVDATKLNKMAGVSKIELKERAEQRIPQDKDEMNTLREVFKDVFIQNNDIDPDDEESGIDPSDLFIL